MRVKAALLCAAAVLSVALGSVPAIAAASNPLARYRGKARVLLVLAPQADDRNVAAQRAAFSAMGDGATSRDLVLVEVIGHTAEAAELHNRFDLDDTGFHAVLIGKDGGDKLASDAPLGAEALYPLIDAMPMRQQEMRQRS